LTTFMESSSSTSRSTCHEGPARISIVAPVTEAVVAKLNAAARRSGDWCSPVSGCLSTRRPTKRYATRRAAGWHSGRATPRPHDAGAGSGPSGEAMAARAAAAPWRRGSPNPDRIFIRMATGQGNTISTLHRIAWRRRLLSAITPARPEVRSGNAPDGVMSERAGDRGARCHHLKSASEPLRPCRIIPVVRTHTG
jgi:hypothetical protein